MGKKVHVRGEKGTPSEKRYTIAGKQGTPSQENKYTLAEEKVHRAKEKIRHAEEKERHLLTADNASTQGAHWWWELTAQGELAVEGCVCCWWKREKVFCTRVFRG